MNAVVMAFIYLFMGSSSFTEICLRLLIPLAMNSMMKLGSALLSSRLLRDNISNTAQLIRNAIFNRAGMLE